MFENGFPREWSTIKKLALLFRAVVNAIAPVLKTVTGAIIHITDALAKPVQALSVKLEPIQAGSGDPSPDNIRPISGWRGASIHVSPTTDAADGETYSITFPAEAGTVYGGTLDVTSGKLMVNRAIVTISSSWNPALSSTGDTVAVAQYSQNYFPGIASAPLPVSNRFSTNIPSGQIGRMVYGAPNLYLAVPKSELASVNVDGLKSWFGSHETQVCYKLATPIEVDLTPTEIALFAGENNLWSDANGNLELTYLADGNVSEIEALNILLGGQYSNNHGEDEPTDREALNILLGGNER